MFSSKKGISLYCFSPLVMIITFIVEISLAFYSFVKSRKAKSDVGIVLILVFLALFQLSEYKICDNTNILEWSRIGMFSITLLPVLGIYLIYKLNKKSYLLKFSSLIAIFFLSYFIFNPRSVNEVACTGNYVIFDIDSTIHALYGYYYFGFLLLGIWEAALGIKEHAEEIQKALKWFIIGYLSFILPLTIAYVVIPITRNGVASIMCGFAVVFAIILTFKIGPIYHKYVKMEKKEVK